MQCPVCRMKFESLGEDQWRLDVEDLLQHILQEHIISREELDKAILDHMNSLHTT